MITGKHPSHPLCSAAGYVVVTDEATGRTIPNVFLDKVKEEFITKYAEKGKTVQELGLSNFGCVRSSSSRSD